MHRILSRPPMIGIFHTFNRFNPPTIIPHRKFIKETIISHIENAENYTKEPTIKNEILNREKEKEKEISQKNIQNYKATLTQNFYTYMEQGFKDPRHLDYYIEQGVDITSNNNYALILACKEGNLDVMKKLVIHGANITSNRDWLLNIASTLGHFEIVKFLVYSHRFTGGDLAEAFTLACKNGHLPIVVFLHDHGAPIEGCGFRGEPIKVATDTKVIEYLNRFGNNGPQPKKKGKKLFVLTCFAGAFFIFIPLYTIKLAFDSDRQWWERIIRGW